MRKVILGFCAVMGICLATFHLFGPIGPIGKKSQVQFTPVSVAAPRPLSPREQAEKLVEMQRTEPKDLDETAQYLFRAFTPIASSPNATLTLGIEGTDKYTSEVEIGLHHPAFKKMGKCLRDGPIELAMRKKAHISTGMELASDWLDITCVEEVVTHDPSHPYAKARFAQCSTTPAEVSACAGSFFTLQWARRFSEC